MEEEMRLVDYETLKNEGRLVELPFFIGSKFYSYDVCWDGTTKGRTWTVGKYEYDGTNLYIHTASSYDTYFNCNEIGKTIFGTKEEAEKAASKIGKMEIFLPC